MKYKTLTKGGSTYYRKLKTLIPIKGKYEKDFLNTILQNLESICSEQPAITYHELQPSVEQDQESITLLIMLNNGL